MYIGLHVKYRLLLSDCNETWIYFDRFSEKTHTSNLMKIRPVGAELFYAEGQTDRQTDMTRLIVGFRSFADAPKTV